jgi:hypothetical protein
VTLLRLLWPESVAEPDPVAGSEAVTRPAAAAGSATSA